MDGVFEHPINKSGKKKLIVSVWDFKAVHPQSERSHYLCNDHPAKMRPLLARAILQLYGESPVLDPMAGIGTTLIEAMLLGMDAIGIEYEKKFVKQANKNIKHIRRTHSDLKLGKAVCFQGDARKLSDIMKKKRVKSILFSPPYWKAMKCQVSSEKEAMKKYRSSVEIVKRIGGNPISKALARSSMGYGRSKRNVGNIKDYGNLFGSILFSPPYFDTLSMNKGGGSKISILYEETTQELQMKRSGPFAVKKNLPTPYSSKDGNIGKTHKFGSIIFSPPYCGVMDARRHVGGIASRDPQLAKTGFYSKNEKNIGNIRQFGSIITSPPYGEANRGSGISKMGYKGRDEILKNRCDRPLSRNKNNIGNICYEQTYLGEMFKVYSECYRVLKPGKFMVVVVKDIQRKWKTIPLGADTIKLCQLAGFGCHDIIINKMYFPSFWMINLARKSQTKANKGTEKFHVLKSHEYVLVFRKPE